MTKTSKSINNTSGTVQKVLKSVGSAIKYLLIPDEKSEKSTIRRTGLHYANENIETKHYGRFNFNVVAKTKPQEKNQQQNTNTTIDMTPKKQNKSDKSIEMQ
jgi:hypothetical protein